MTWVLLVLALTMGVWGASAATGPIIGIDLGTTYSCVALYRQGRVEIIANDQGNRITPSWVGFDGTKRLVGEAAKNQGIVNAANTVFDVKRLMGRRFDDPTVQKDRHMWPFTIVARNDTGGVLVAIADGQQQFSPEEISAMILRKMKETAEAYYGGPITRAVITVPAYFNDAQRQATRDAGAIAGLVVERIINEPTAAAIAYGVEAAVGTSAQTEERNVMVVDLGGGTHDVTLLTFDQGLIEVLATSGDTHLGGEDFDQRIMQHLLTKFQEKTGHDLASDKRALQKIRREAERAKKVLSAQTMVEITIEDLAGGHDMHQTLSRATFEKINEDLFARVLEPVRQVLADAKLTKDRVHDILLVGGSTRIPRVQQLLSEFFGGRALNKGVNPDEAVAAGAAIQGARIGGDAPSEDMVTLLDVTPLSLGIETVGGIQTVMIPRNSKVPTKHTRAFSTAHDGQRTVDIRVFEGERALTKDNHELGHVLLEGLPEGLPRGQPQIEVTFELDVNSVLTVSGRLVNGDATTRIEIHTEKGRLTQAEIDALLAEAEAKAAEDSAVKQLAERRNALEQAAHALKDKDTIDWLEQNPHAKLEELDQRIATLQQREPPKHDL